VELAVVQRWQLERLNRGGQFVLSDGSRVVVRGNRVGRLTADGAFYPVPADEEVVFDGTLFIPPFGTVNRTVEGQLGKYKLDLGEGYLIHGTPDPSTVGSATTHGCLRMLEDDLEFLYRNVPLGTPVIIF
jgi:lipoprotein-anchoring transpeptidase ErfK/SrfK